MTRSGPAATGVVTAPTWTGFASVPDAEAAGSAAASPVGGRPARCCTCAAYRCQRACPNVRAGSQGLPRLAQWMRLGSSTSSRTGSAFQRGSSTARSGPT